MTCIHLAKGSNPKVFDLHAPAWGAVLELSIERKFKDLGLTLGAHFFFERNKPLVDVAPGPGLAGLERGRDRMSDLVKVFCRVLILGRIAAADVAAA